MELKSAKSVQQKPPPVYVVHKVVICSKCKLIFANQSILDGHWKKAHKTFQCNICAHVSSTLKFLQRHIFFNHSPKERLRKHSTKLESAPNGHIESLFGNEHDSDGEFSLELLLNKHKTDKEEVIELSSFIAKLSADITAQFEQHYQATNNIAGTSSSIQSHQSQPQHSVASTSQISELELLPELSPSASETIVDQQQTEPIIENNIEVITIDSDTDEEVESEQIESEAIEIEAIKEEVEDEVMLLALVEQTKTQRRYYCQLCSRITKCQMQLDAHMKKVHLVEEY